MKKNAKPKSSKPTKSTTEKKAAKVDKPKRLSALDAAAIVLKKAGKPAQSAHHAKRVQYVRLPVLVELAAMGLERKRDYIFK